MLKTLRRLTQGGGGGEKARILIIKIELLLYCLLYCINTIIEIHTSAGNEVLMKLVESWALGGFVLPTLQHHAIHFLRATGGLSQPLFSLF